MKQYDAVIVGCGFAGSVMAERFAQLDKKVLVLEKRNHIGGNMYDYLDDFGVRVHKYGPHLFHTSRKEVFEYLSEFTEWYPYEHRVLGYVDGKLVPIPFNLKSIEMCFESEMAERIKKTLIETYGLGKKATILELRKNENPDIQILADFVFEKVFKHYTMKQWGLTVDELDPGVTNRVPVYVSYDDRYFQDDFQVMPKEGYTRIFERMLNHPNIDVILSVDAKTRIKLDFETSVILLDNQPFKGPVVFTGALDELLDYRYGPLPYRSEEFDLQSQIGTFQPVGTVNYPTPAEEHGYTRITEYKHMMQEQPAGTTLAIEYPYPFNPDAEKGNIPYYPIFTPQNQTLYERYVEAIKPFGSLHIVGRLAEYKYYNMDAIVYHALKVFERIIEK